MTDYLKLLDIALMNDISVHYENAIISDSYVINTFETYQIWKKMHLAIDVLLSLK